ARAPRSPPSPWRSASRARTSRARAPGSHRETRPTYRLVAAARRARSRPGASRSRRSARRSRRAWWGSPRRASSRTALPGVRGDRTLAGDRDGAQQARRDALNRALSVDPVRAAGGQHGDREVVATPLHAGALVHEPGAPAALDQHAEAPARRPWAPPPRLPAAPPRRARAVPRGP